MIEAQHGMEFTASGSDGIVVVPRNGESIAAAKRKLDAEIADEHTNTLREEERTLVKLLRQRLVLEKAS